MRFQRAKTAATFFSFAAAMMFAANSAQAVVDWNESVNGELSGSGSAPTSLGTLNPGTHSIVATSGSGDQDDITFTVPAGTTLGSIIPFSYTGLDGTAFCGLGSGSTINTTGSAGSLLGFAHFGTTPGNVGSNLVPAMSTSNTLSTAATGFTPPLGPGTYSVWMQQLGSPANFQMDFVVTPEPGSLTLLAAATGAAVIRRRRRVR